MELFWFTTKLFFWKRFFATAFSFYCTKNRLFEKKKFKMSFWLFWSLDYFFKIDVNMLPKDIGKFRDNKKSLSCLQNAESPICFNRAMKLVIILVNWVLGLQDYFLIEPKYFFYTFIKVWRNITKGEKKYLELTIIFKAHALFLFFYNLILKNSDGNYKKRLSNIAYFYNFISCFNQGHHDIFLCEWTIWKKRIGH